eukprot:comp23360_c2_seq1/m.38594 comp23360_c2_seq1/g.38594  ORF comp23360_c2_seq1/g.38594 comp23360_c2_seq1/m.38594 type:complete len:526 (-) comp23360_c2_seq1:561-2138(-)
MVLLAAGICTKQGKAVVSRQFIEMTRSRIEGLFAAFPKLQSSGKQHTFVETESVRYVYQPVEQLYVVLITTKNSNILEDLETLHLFARVIPEYCRSLDEREISDKSFELIFAFDEIVALGYRESVSLAQIRTFTEMDSHEEKMFQMVQKNKEKEAKEEMKRKMKELERQKKEAGGGRRSGGMLGGFGGGFGSNTTGMGQGGSMGGMGPSSFGGNQQQNDFSGGSSYVPPPRDAPKPAAGKGLKLGGKKKMDEFVSALANEGQRIAEPTTSFAPQLARAPSLGAPTRTESIHIKIEEKVVLTANRDGGMQGMEIKGDLILRVSDPDKARIRVDLALPDDKPFQYKTHPNCNKQLFNDESAIALKDPSRPFPLNADQGVLKYRLATTDDSLLPLSVNCWPSINADGTADVNIEYELEDTRLVLERVTIHIPVPSQPKVGNCDGEFFFNTRDRRLEWTVPLIDGNSPTGSMEFSAQVQDPNVFFPVHVDFVSSSSFSDIQITSVTTPDGAPLTFSSETSFGVENYSIV